jgi:hypothetical protein
MKTGFVTAVISAWLLGSLPAQTPLQSATRSISPATNVGAASNVSVESVEARLADARANLAAAVALGDAGVTNVPAGAFAEHGIVIDFPQRDIHLHASRPIQVEVMPGAHVEPQTATPPNRTESNPGVQPTKAQS